MTIHESKEIYWKHFLNNKRYWPKGCTEKRMSKIKEYVFQDERFWDDILLRHKCETYYPEILSRLKPEIYEHMMGNMAGMIMQILRNKNENND